jgi:CHAD domain-containing protein
MMRTPGPAFDLRAALSNELRTAIDELELTPTKRKALHRCRVRVKRARALARVGRACAPGLSAVFNDSARAVMRTLAQARDVAALAEAARATAKKADKKAAAALGVIGDALITASDAPALNLESARSGLKDLLALAQVWPEASHRQIRRGAERIARLARRAYRRGRRSGEIAHRHEWRKREKDRFYATLILDEAWPSARRAKDAEKLGDALGAERDALLLIDRIEEHPDLAGEPKAAKRALKALRKRAERFARRSDDIGADLHARGA